MTMTKRTQGRPPRSSGVNGRDKLIEATRIYLQSNRKTIITRTEIAQGCGVTPALISYYFKDKKSLLEAVTKPLMRSYRSRLAALSSSADAVEVRMLSVIRLLIELHIDHGFLVDHLLRPTDQDELDSEDRAAAQAFHETIAGLVGRLLETGIWRPMDPVLGELALWGICRALGETLRAGDARVVPLPAQMLERYVSFAFDTFRLQPDRPPDVWSVAGIRP